MKYLGDLTEDQTINFKFSTHAADGTPTTLAGTPALKIYKGAATDSEIATGVTLSVDFDGITGLNNVAIDTSADAFYAIGSDYSVVITTGTVNSVSVVGVELATFSIENRFGDATGTGARTVTFVVNDGTDLIKGATLRVTKGVTSISGDTNVSGQINSGSGFSLDDGTWTVAISLSGYSFTPTTLVVSADSAQTYSMSAETIAASDPDQVTGYFYCYDEDGAVEEDVTVQIKFVSIVGTGISHDTKIRSEVSGATGLVSFTNLFPGATYKIRRGEDRAWSDIEIPSTATGTYAISNVWGLDG